MSTSFALQQMQRNADSFSLELSEESWFELMHWHPDIYGTGNASPSARGVCTSLAKQYLTTAMEALREWNKASQCWCLLDSGDSGQDSVYVHTENPNRANFPYPFEDVTWGVEAPIWVTTVFAPANYTVGVSGKSPELLYWVVEKTPHPVVNTDLFFTSGVSNAL